MSSDYGVLAGNMQWGLIDQSLVLYIPHVSKELGVEYICNIFKKLDIATVSYIHLKKTDNLYNAATVYMQSWNNSHCVENLQEKINDKGQEARVIYDDPDY